MDDFASIDIDDIVKSSIDDLVKVLKRKVTLYIGYDNKQNVAITKICTAMNQIGYAKGLKKGKSIGSHQAYNHFLKQAHWEDKIPYDDVKHGRWILFWSISTGDCFVCSECGGRVVLAYTYKTSFKSPADKYRYCPHCGTRMEVNTND